MNISEKANKVLRFLLLAMLLILFRLWHLCFLQKEEMHKLALRPQRKTIIEPAERGTIHDREGKGLALNRIAYKAAIYYSQINQIPAIAWKTEEGKKVKYYPRREYVRSLSEKLGQELAMDQERICDLIYAKAALLPHAPFIIKENLTEKEFYRLRMLERDWAGLHAQRGAERFYPMGKSCSDILGYMGAIAQKEYLSIADEIKQLQAYFDDIEMDAGAAERLQELQEKAYSLNDWIGKGGIEKSFEEDLRGFYGIKSFEIDVKGNFLQELAGSKPSIAGKRVILSISSELQEFAEALLAEAEQRKEKTEEKKYPWIKGGAIVVMDPNTSEVLALASTPRFDPNDFVKAIHPKEKEEAIPRIHQWLETQQRISDLWNGKEELKRELYSKKKGFYEEALPLTWDNFLNFILPVDSEIRLALEKVNTIEKAISLQEDFDRLLYLSQKEPLQVILDENLPEGRRCAAILSSITSPQDKLFLIDLCRLAIHSPAFSDELIAKIGKTPLNTYHEWSRSLLKMERELKKEKRKLFSENQFKVWKQEHQKEYLKQMRAKEKAQKTFARPYIDYLDRKERELFSEYWQENRLDFLLKEAPPILASLDPPLMYNLLKTVRSYEDLDRPLYHKKGKKEKHLAASFYPQTGFGFGRSYAFRQSVPLGSIFKVVTSYAALKQKALTQPVRSYTELNPLTIVDEFRYDMKAAKKGSFVVAYSLDHAPYPRMYKGGRLPRSTNPKMGKIDLFSALEQTSNPYFSILAADHLQDPLDLVTTAASLGFGAKTQIALPGEIAGNLPDDVAENKTGLYSLAIGQHTLTVTPLQTAVMLSALANHGKILKPKIANTLIGKNRSSSELFPIPTETTREIYLPNPVRDALLIGMNRVVSGEKGTARADIIPFLRKNPSLAEEYKSLRNQFIGKTSTAEVMYNPYSYPSSKAHMYKHIWFGALSFELPSEKCTAQEMLKAKPELAVVVFLRFGDAGKDAAPLAARLVKKYRAIKERLKAEG